MIFFLNTNFSLSFYKRTRSSSFIRTRSSWIFYTRFFWTRITRIKRIFYFAHGSRILPTALWTRDFFEHLILFEHESHEIRRRPTDQREVITRIYLARGSFFFYTHTDLTDLTDLFAYGSSWLWDSWTSNEAQKMISVSHAKHWQIRETCEIRVT